MVYNLNNIKEIKVTEDFLGLSKTIRRCEKYESYDDCKTKNYIDALMKSCKCLPFAIREADKVILFENQFWSFVSSLN